MTPEDALDYVRACRDTHVGWDEAAVESHAIAEHDGPAAVVAFHEQTAAEYDEVLAALTPLVELHVRDAVVGAT